MQRQVPINYLLIGDGRLALHMSHYFAAHEMRFEQWSRRYQTVDDLTQCVKRADYILLLISDDAIDGFIEQHTLFDQSLIHCSGAITSHYARACHPLMTFGDDLYSQSVYESIPFVCDKSLDFEQVFPLINNSHYTLSDADKASYHAMAVMAANFPQFIWQRLLPEFEHQLNLPYSILYPLIKQSMLNSFSSPKTAPTGPFVRNDQQTILRHKNALRSSDLSPLYQAFESWLEKQPLLNRNSP